MQQGSIETDGLVGNDCVGMPVEACGEETLLEIEYHINHTFLKRFEPKIPRPYDNEEYEETSDTVAEDKVEYGKQ